MAKEVQIENYLMLQKAPHPFSDFELFLRNHNTCKTSKS